MYQMVLLVLNNLDECTPVLSAWESVGVGGITILESTGLGHARRAGIPADIPLLPRLSDFVKRPEHRHRTIFTVVDNDEMVDQLIEVTENVIGDFEGAHNGALFVLPVARAIGVKGGQRRAQKGKDTSED